MTARRSCSRQTAAICSSSREHVSRGVVRRVEYQQAGAVGDGGPQRVDVQREVGASHPDGPVGAAGNGHVGAVGVVPRLEEHDLVARLAEGEHCGRDALGRAGTDSHLGVRVPGGSAEPLLVGGHGLAQLGQPDAGCVLVAAVTDGRDGGVEDLGGAVVVGEALPQVHGVVLAGQRRHGREDGRADSLEPACEVWLVHGTSARGRAYGRTRATVRPAERTGVPVELGVRPLPACPASQICCQGRLRQCVSSTARTVTFVTSVL